MTQDSDDDNLFVIPTRGHQPETPAEEPDTFASPAEVKSKRQRAPKPPRIKTDRRARRAQITEVSSTAEVQEEVRRFRDEPQPRVDPEPIPEAAIEARRERERERTAAAFAPQRDLEDAKPRRKRKLGVGGVIAIAAAAALVVGGVGGFLANRFLVPQEASAETVAESLRTEGLPSLPAGYTAQDVLDLPRTNTAEKQYDDISSEIANALGAKFGVEFESVSKGGSVELTLPGVENSVLYQVNSPTLASVGLSMTVEQRREAVEIINATVTRYAYLPFDPESMYTGVYADETERERAFGSVDPISSTFLNVTNVNKDRPSERYSVSITGTPDGSDSGMMQASSVSIIFTSYPHLKKGSDAVFKERITKEFEERQRALETNQPTVLPQPDGNQPQPTQAPAPDYGEPVQETPAPDAPVEENPDEEAPADSSDTE